MTTRTRCRACSTGLGFNPNTDLRLAYGMGIARPNFSDLPPFVIQSDKKQTVDVGNPNLRPTRANNFDVLLEHFFEPLGVVQGGAFYKALKDPIYGGVETQVIGGIYDGYTQSQPINGPDATSPARTGLAAAPDLHAWMAGGLGVLANYSYTTSKPSAWTVG